MRHLSRESASAPVSTSLSGPSQARLFLHRFQKTNSALRFLDHLYSADGIITLILPPVTGPEKEILQDAQFPVNGDSHTGLQPRSLVLLNQERVNLAQLLTTEGCFEVLNATAVAFLCVWSLPFLSPVQE